MKLYKDFLKIMQSDDYNPMPVEVFISTDMVYSSQSITLNLARSVRERVDEIPETLCKSKKTGWETTVTFDKENLPEIIHFLYEGKDAGLDLEPLLTQKRSSTLYIFAYWD